MVGRRAPGTARQGGGGGEGWQPRARAQQQQFEDASQSLQSMFPLLDKDLIEDVLHQSGTNLGAAVDMCLALAN